MRTGASRLHDGRAQGQWPVPSRGRVALLVYFLVGLLLGGAYGAAPDPFAWYPEDGALLEAAFERGAAAPNLFPGWRPEASPVLLTKGRVNYLINFPTGAEQPPGRTLEADRLRVLQLDRPEVPVLANGVVEVEGHPVVLLAGRRQLEGAVGGLMAEQTIMQGGEAELVKGLLRVDPGHRLTDEEYIGVVLHEAFHLYQLPIIQRWADEISVASPEKRLWNELYTDAENNRLQDAEATHLLTALRAQTADNLKEEAVAFLAARGVRVAYWQERLGEAEANALLEWERRYEWMEGLARYVQIRMQESGAEELMAQIGEPVDPVMTRERVYRLGAGQALVLDRLAQGWQEQTMTGVPLDDLLRQAIEGR